MVVEMVAMARIQLAMQRSMVVEEEEEAMEQQMDSTLVQATKE